MIYKVLTTLGVAAAIAGMASSAQAQSAVASSSQTGRLTLSGNSLTSIESRTVNDDFNKFFLNNSSTISTTSNSAGGDNNLSLRDVGLSPNSDDVNVVVKQPLTSPVPPIPLRSEEPFYSNDRVQVQVGLD